VIEFGIIACILVIPFAMIAGHFRGMPYWWRVIDCSFGIIGLFPLMICLKNIKRLEVEEKEKSEKRETFDMLIA
jgi:Na+/melibiose symporter-like transporter